ncbi:MAG: hypothetical protein JHD24_10315 [Polynucleobacter sp.]|jgi:hypothetical protein|nr:hypothetical protein [Polynucleobacter sp.]NQW58242.1 hypothetical protein [Polynucleobacter sp.]
MLWSKKKTKLASRKPVTPALKTAVQVTDPNPEAVLKDELRDAANLIRYEKASAIATLKRWLNEDKLH